MIFLTQLIEFRFLGMDLLEPNVLITDLLLGILSVSFAIRISRLPSKHPFFNHWTRFLFLFGAGTILGGFGHVFINYLGISGKIPAWILSIVSVYFIEISMFSLLRNERKYKILTRLSLAKLVLVLFLLLLTVITVHPSSKIDSSILVVIINSLFGVILSAGILGYSYYRLGFSKHFLRLVGGVLILIPSSLVFLLELNLLRWFDRNDLSHLIIALGITLFYQAVVRIYWQNPEIVQPSWIHGKKSQSRVSGH